MSVCTTKSAVSRASGKPRDDPEPELYGAIARARGERRTIALTELGPSALAPPDPPRRGFRPWPRLPNGTDESAVVAAAPRRGVSASAGAPYFTGAPTRRICG